MEPWQVASNFRWALWTLVFFVIAGLSSLPALGQEALPAGVPAPPPGGISPAKLPDTNGVHLGMSVDQAMAVIKGLYPRDLTTVTTEKQADGTVWTRNIKADNKQNCNASCDSIVVSFSRPPNPVQVIGIERAINSGSSTPPTVDAVVASLRQKYGKEVMSDVGVMAWAYDEQGQPTTPHGPSNWRPADCATAGNLEVPGPTPLAQILPKLTRDLCNRGVFVSVQVLPGAGIQGVPVAPQIFMHLGERSLEFRDGVVAQQYAEARAANQKQQEMKKAQQQAAPKL